MAIHAQLIPLAQILEGAEYTAIWRPDWPVDIPPDAFTLKAGEALRSVVTGEGFFLEYSIGTVGLTERFPFMLNGKMAQVSLVYAENSEIMELVITFLPGEEPWRLEVLEHRDSYPYIVRGSSGGVWYFIYFHRTANEILETWYDVDGNFLGAYRYYLTLIDQDRRIRIVQDLANPGMDTELFFDSRGFVTEIRGPDGFFRALYFREELPRFWERRPVTGGTETDAGNFILQWGANDHLVRVTGGNGGRPEEYHSIDFRYEYDLDFIGNWVERREIRMVRVFDLLVPETGTTFSRFVEYK